MDGCHQFQRNIRLAKALTAIDRLSIIWKLDLTDRLKRIFPNSGRVDTDVWMQYITKRIEIKLDGNYTRMLQAIWNNS